MSSPEYPPRLMLCFLGQPGGFAELHRSIQSAIDTIAPDFEIDTEYAQDGPDDRMLQSFRACWDQVHPDAYTAKDHEAVRLHGCVIYVAGPHTNPETAVETSARGLRLVVSALRGGATAVKVESASVAHGAARWEQLGRDAEGAKTKDVLCNICRLAVAKRPITDGEFLYSVGFHLVGLPEVYVPASLSEDELELSAIIDRVADEMAADGVDAVLARHNARLLPVDAYEEDEFFYNPYGAVYLNAAPN
jgi:hypothetical protein